MREIFTPFNREKLDKKQGTARPMMRPLATFSFLLTTFSFFHSPRPSFLPVPPSSFLLPVFRCVRISIRGWSVGPLVGWSVMLSSKSMKKRLLRILNNLDSVGQGKKRAEEEGGTGRKEGRGGRRDEKSEKMKKLLTKKKK